MAMRHCGTAMVHNSDGLVCEACGKVLSYKAEHNKKKHRHDSTKRQKKKVEG